MIDVAKTLSAVLESQWDKLQCKIRYKRKPEADPNKSEAVESEIYEAELRLLEKLLPSAMEDLPTPTELLFL